MGPYAVSNAGAVVANGIVYQFAGQTDGSQNTGLTTWMKYVGNVDPTATPTMNPTDNPSSHPTANPTTANPTAIVTISPSIDPTTEPTVVLISVPPTIVFDESSASIVN